MTSFYQPFVGSSLLAITRAGGCHGRQLDASSISHSGSRWATHDRPVTGTLEKSFERACSPTGLDHVAESDAVGS
jgi:hypothetical protein